MNYFIEMITLGLVQGFTEFLPISSSAHLIFIQELLKMNSPGAVVEIVLHLGTLSSIIVFYRKDLVNLLKGCINNEKEDLSLVLKIIIATIPAIFGGLIIKNHIELFFSSVFYSGICLCFTGFMLFLLKLRETKDYPIHYTTAFIIGIAQMFAILPGISRSGITITLAILIGISGTTAFRFSFLLAIPIITGAGILSFFDIQNLDSSLILPLLFGSITAAITGFMALKILHRMIIEKKMWWFSIYCLILGLIGIYFGI